jgi:hypothetical protein
MKWTLIFRTPSGCCLITKTKAQLLLSVLSGKLHSFLLLTLIAKPHAHDVLFEIKLLGNGGNFLTRWSWLDGKISFQRAFLWCRNGCPFSWKKTRYRLLINFKLLWNQRWDKAMNSKHFTQLKENKWQKLTHKYKTQKKIMWKWKIKTKNFAYLFFSLCGNTLGASGSRRLFFACASASSSHAWRIGFNAIMLLCDSVRLSNLHIVLCDKAPTPGNFRFANAFPTSACVTPSFDVKLQSRIFFFRSLFVVLHVVLCVNDATRDVVRMTMKGWRREFVCVCIMGGRKKKWEKNKKNNNIFSQMDIIRGNYVQHKEFAEKFIALIISFLVGERKMLLLLRT